MRKIKRIAGILSSLALLLTMVPLTAIAADLPEPAHSKTITSNEDGTYTLNLDVTGKVSEETVVKPADILLIVDTSGSMEWPISMWSRTSRMEKIQSLVGHLADTVLASGTNRMAIVPFSGSLHRNGKGDTAYNDVGTITNWTSEASTIKAGIGQLKPDGATNWEAGFLSGKTLMEPEGNVRAEAEKYVVFLSDGNPTVRYDGSGITIGDGESTSQEDVNEAIAAANSISRDVFFSVGIGGNTNRMSELATAVGGSYANGSDETALDAAFADLESMFVQNYKGVVITDPLSQYVDMVSPDNLRLNAAAVEANATAAYDAATRTVTLTFPQDFVLQTDVTYSVSFDVVPSQIAKDEYVSSGQIYPAIGDDGTGETSAGQGGFYSNENATVTYVKTSGTTSNPTVETKTAEYKKPVIQVPIPPITVLPSAGGHGVYGLIAFGIAMVVFALTLLIRQKRRIL